LVYIVCLSVSSAFAQWRIQDIALVPGWNAVQLEITPEPFECEKIFAGLQIESVWKWNKRFTTTEFNVDPGTLLPDDPHWLVWFPTNSPNAFLTKLHNMSAGGGYLIKLDDEAAPYVLSLRGKAKIRNAEWSPHSVNLAGFPVDSSNPPTFADYFEYCPNIDTSNGSKNELFRINPDGTTSRIVATARDRMERNRAYWIKCKYIPKASSVLGIKEGVELEFKDYIDEQNFVVRNQSATDSLTVSLKEIASELPPAGDEFPENAGMVPLAYYAYNVASNYWSWTNMAENTPMTKTLDPGEKWELKFAVRRNNMPSYTPSGTNSYSFQSILEVTGDSPAGVYYVPVSATPVGSSNVVDETKVKNKGLWVGEVRLYSVNCPAYVSDTNDLTEIVFTNSVSGEVFTNSAVTNMMPTDSVCNMRLIVHVDADGNAKLLRDIFLATVPLDDGRNEQRLYADRSDLPNDATDISRISCVTFPFIQPLTLAGSMTNSMTAAFTLDCNDPVNPFLHRYNPLHDNKDWDFNSYSNAVETLTVTRAIRLGFGEKVSDAAGNPFWGSSTQGGAYREVLLGLRKQPIVVEGDFVLKRISLLDKLY